jgi:hypothetical protein
VRILTGKDLVPQRRGTAVSLVQKYPRLRERFASEADQAFLESSLLPAGFFSYDWHLAEHYENAVRRVKGALLAAQTGLPATFFTDAARDIYAYDRALWAADDVDTQPIRQRDIPLVVIRKMKVAVTRFRDEYSSTYGYRSIGYTCEERQDVRYTLCKEAFEWNSRIPASAVDAAVSVIESEAPDRFWIAQYLPDGRGSDAKWYSVIYAEYGEWQVEVARWE